MNTGISLALALTMASPAAAGARPQTAAQKQPCDSASPTYVCNWEYDKNCNNTSWDWINQLLGQFGYLPDINCPQTPDCDSSSCPTLPGCEDNNGNNDSGNNPGANPGDDGASNPDNGNSSESENDTKPSAYAQKVVQLVNEERAKQGLSPLQVSNTVTSAAQVRTSEINKSFSHTRPDGTSCFTALEQAGVSYRGAGENIAYGQPTPEAVVDAWMNSPGHRANILNEQFTTIGVGYEVINGSAYWVQMFTY